MAPFKSCFLKSAPIQTLSSKSQFVLCSSLQTLLALKQSQWRAANMIAVLKVNLTLEICSQARTGKTQQRVLAELHEFLKDPKEIDHQLIEMLWCNWKPLLKGVEEVSRHSKFQTCNQRVVLWRDSQRQVLLIGVVAVFLQRSHYKRNNKLLCQTFTSEMCRKQVELAVLLDCQERQ